MKKAIFLKNSAGVGYGYMKGDIANLEDKVFADLENLKYVRAVQMTDTPEVTPDLPEDIPGRHALVDAGFETIADVKSVADLTEIKGIGNKLAAQIKEFLA